MVILIKCLKLIESRAKYRKQQAMYQSRVLLTVFFPAPLLLLTTREISRGPYLKLPGDIRHT